MSWEDDTYVRPLASSLLISPGAAAMYFRTAASLPILHDSCSNRISIGKEGGEFSGKVSIA